MVTQQDRDLTPDNHNPSAVDRARQNGLTTERGLALLEEQLPGVYIVPRNVELRIDLGALLLDFDGTIADTEDLLYSGPESCNAFVIKKILSDPAFASIADKYLADKGESFPRFDPKGWAEEWKLRNFKSCTGGGLINDSIKFSEKILSTYGVDITFGEFKAMYEHARSEHLMSILHKIELIANVKPFLEHLSDAGVALGICSAAPGENINGIAQYHGIDRSFQVVCANAKKKQPNGQYDGSAVDSARKMLNVDAGICALIGDSMSDVGTAALGGLPLVIIRVPDDNPALVEKLVKEIQENLMATRGVEFGPGKCEVLIVHDYDQIRIVSSKDDSRDPNKPLSWSANLAFDTTAIDHAKHEKSATLPTFPDHWAQSPNVDTNGHVH